jgi:hypothetical protein
MRTKKMTQHGGERGSGENRIRGVETHDDNVGRVHWKIRYNHTIHKRPT